MSDFIEWLNDEIKELENSASGNLFTQGKYAEAIRIRHELCKIDKEKENENRKHLHRHSANNRRVRRSTALRGKRLHEGQGKDTRL